MTAATVTITLPRAPLPESTMVYLSHSRGESYTRCPFAYYLQYEEHWESDAEGCALGFGNAVHSGCAAFLISTITNAVCDPVAIFVAEWNKFCATKIVDFGKQWTKEKLDETGEALVKAFMEWWPTSGFTVLVDVKGDPVVERKFRVNLPGNIRYTAIIDLMARDAEGRVAVLDLKTPAQLAIEGFAQLSEQLLGYQIVADAHRDELGIKQVDRMAFIELHKVTVKPPPKKTTSKQPLQPRVAPVEFAERRSKGHVAAWIMERRKIADDLRSRRFPRRPGDSFSTPCSMCDRMLLCMTGDTTGLQKRPYRSSRSTNNKVVSSTRQSDGAAAAAPF